MSKIYEATSTDAIKSLINSLDGITFVSFFSPTCGPCMMLEPILEELAKTKKRINLVRINVMDYPEIINDWNVNAWPTNFVYKDKVEVKKIVGFQPLEEWENLLNTIQ